MPTSAPREDVSYTFAIPSLAADFDVVRFQGREGLSELFAFELELVSVDLDVDLRVNEPATLTMAREGEEDVPVHGIVTHFEQEGRSSEWAGYQVTLRPRLWRLTLAFRSRVFVEQNIQEVLTKVFKEHGLAANDVRFALKESYAPMEYCVQYRETDFDFVSRLMEHEGLYYFFEQKEGRDVVVITDHRGTHEPIAEPATLHFHDAGGFHYREVERVHYFAGRAQMTAQKALVRDYNYEKPELVTSEQGDGTEPVHYEYGAGVGDERTAKRRARVRFEELEAQRLVMRGESGRMALRSGYQFSLEDHYRERFNIDYLVTHVEHRGSQRSALNFEMGDTEAEDEPAYQNAFTCIPAEVQYRAPRVTPVPQVSGVITAEVEGSSQSGQYAYMDEHGRYRARMHFDTDKSTASGAASLPIRMNQPYTGAGYGIHFPNHVGTEMILAHVNGDPNRPIALGTAPNPAKESPVQGENLTENVIRTHAGNELVMDDEQDAAQVRLASADKNTLLLDDKGDRIQVATTNKHTATLDDKNQNIKVQTKDGHFVIMDDKNKKITVQSKSGHVISINDDKENITLSDKKGKNRFVIDIKNNQIVIETKEGGIDLKAPKGIVGIDAKEMKVKTQGDTSFDVNKMTVKAQSDIQLDGNNIKVNGKGAVSVKATQDYTQEGMNVTSKATMAHKIEGLQVSAKGKAQNDVQGAMVSVKASGINQIQGSLVKIN